MSQADRLRQIITEDPVVYPALVTARDLDLSDWWIVSGAIYNTVWNSLTGMPAGHGIKDIDLFYFDPDTSWEAEDAVIRRAGPFFAPTPPIEIRNQARVHLWYEQQFGRPITALKNTRDAIDGFASETHAVGVRLIDADDIEIYAPYGLDTVFEMRMVPNPRQPNGDTHTQKGIRAKALWPDLIVEPWPDRPEIRVADHTAPWPDLLALLHRSFASMDGRIDPTSSLHRLTPSKLAEKAAQETCLVAWMGHVAVGIVFTADRGDHVYVGKLAIEPAWQGHGIGRALMERVIEDADGKPLQLETRIELTENHAAFAAMGFVKIGETAHPGFDRPTSITMRRAP